MVSKSPPPKRACIFNERTMTLKAKEILWKPKIDIGLPIRHSLSMNSFVQMKTHRNHWLANNITDWSDFKKSLNKEMETNPFSNAPFLLLCCLSCLSKKKKSEFPNSSCCPLYPQRALVPSSEPEAVPSLREVFLKFLRT